MFFLSNSFMQVYLTSVDVGHLTSKYNGLQIGQSQIVITLKTVYLCIVLSCFLPSFWVTAIYYKLQCYTDRGVSIDNLHGFKQKFIDYGFLPFFSRVNCYGSNYYHDKYLIKGSRNKARQVTSKQFRENAKHCFLASKCKFFAKTVI